MIIRETPKCTGNKQSQHEILAGDLFHLEKKFNEENINIYCTFFLTASWRNI